MSPLLSPVFSQMAATPEVVPCFWERFPGQPQTRKWRAHSSLPLHLWLQAPRGCWCTELAFVTKLFRPETLRGKQNLTQLTKDSSFEPSPANKTALLCVPLHDLLRKCGYFKDRIWAFLHPWAQCNLLNYCIIKRLNHLVFNNGSILITI